MKIMSPRSAVIPAVLAMLMAATRYHHFGSALHLPDASLAVFFLAGVYLAGWLAFPLLLAEAGLIDFLAITAGGVSDYCISPAYGFLIPTYGVLWLAGRWAARHAVPQWRALLPVAGALVAATSVAFLISNGSFYLWSGKFPELSWLQYAERVARYYPSYLTSALVYVAAAVIVHAAMAAVGTARAARPAGQ